MNKYINIKKSPRAAFACPQGLAASISAPLYIRIFIHRPDRKRSQVRLNRIN